MKRALTVLAVGTAMLTAFGCGKQNTEPNASQPVGSTNATPTATAAAPAAPKAAPTKTYDGPFGLAMGVSSVELVERFHFKEPTADYPSNYWGTPPKPVDGFSGYIAVATKEQGICRLMGIADVDVVNDSGHQLKAKADEIAEMLALKYGKHSNKYDYSTQDVYKRNPQYWMMGLKEEAVVYAYDWKNGKDGLTLPNEINAIEVQASTNSMNSGWVRVTYRFKNNADCVAQMKKQKASNL